MQTLPAQRKSKNARDILPVQYPPNLQRCSKTSTKKCWLERGYLRGAKVSLAGHVWVEIDSLLLLRGQTLAVQWTEVNQCVGGSMPNQHGGWRDASPFRVGWGGAGTGQGRNELMRRWQQLLLPQLEHPLQPGGTTWVSSALCALTHIWRPIAAGCGLPGEVPEETSNSIPAGPGISSCYFCATGAPGAAGLWTGLPISKED